MKSSFLCLVGLAAAAVVCADPVTERDRKAQPAPAAAELAGQVDGSYPVGPKDVLQIEVWNRVQVEYERRDVAVEQDGSIYVPLLGEVKVGGDAVPAITEKLRKLYEGYIQKPQVFIWIKEYNSRVVNMIGEIKTPGRLTLKGGMNLMDALAEAGDVTSDASTICRIMRRGVDGTASTLEIDLAEIGRGDVRKNVELLPGDTIIVLANTDKISVIGEVNGPGRIRLKGSMTVMDAIAEAGDVTDDASPIIRIMRESGDPDQPLIFDVNRVEIGAGDVAQNVVLKPGDTLIALTNDDIVYVSGNVNKPASYPFVAGMTAQQAIIEAGDVSEHGAANRTKIFRLEQNKMTKRQVNAKDMTKPFLLKPGDTVYVPASRL